jgi:acyl-coenzyme A thioesterase PaaI-like protein
MHPFMENKKAFQDYYPDELSHCYGCGRLNKHGLKIKSYWDGQDAVAILEPRPYHIGIPGYVYGGLIASIIDCHCIGTASAAMLKAEGRNIETCLPLRFVTASLHVDYLRPAPIGVALEVRANVEEIKGRKVVVAATVSSKNKVCATGKVVAVQMPEHMKPTGGKT